VAEYEALRITSIVVRADRIVCDLKIDPRHAYTTPAVAAYVSRCFPDLPLHACVNERGDTFGAVIADTSLAHLFEHIVIDIQVSSQVAAVQAQERTFVGTSEWIDEGKGEARVVVNFNDDMDALRAFRAASNIINDAMIECKNG